MYEVRYIKDLDIPKFIYVRDMGNYNKLPRPYRTSNQHEFRRKFSNNIPSYIETRQIKFSKKEKTTDVTIMYFHDMAFALVFDSKWHLRGNDVVYDEPVKYIKIGCEHEMVELSKEVCTSRNIPWYGMYWHVFECSKCGLINAHDSSG